MKYRKATASRNTAQLILNSFICCMKLRTGSVVLACVNIITCVIGIWHSLRFGREFDISGSTDLGRVHYIWSGISVFSLVIAVYLLICLIKKHWRGITIWITWNGFVLILRFTVIVLILALNINNQNIFGNIILHLIDFFLTIYSILILLSYYQQVTLTSFGYYERYSYLGGKEDVFFVDTIRFFRFLMHARLYVLILGYVIFSVMMMAADEHDNSEGECEKECIDEEFV